MIAACNFVSLGEKIGELLDKNGKRKKKREEKKRGKLLITWLDKKGAKFVRCVTCTVFLGEAE